MKKVPFYSQIVNWNGEDSGFPNTDEIKKWQSNCCGIACARMVIDHFTGQNVGYWNLLQNGLSHNAYNEVGWIHRGLVDLISEYGINGKATRGKTVEDIQDSLSKGNIVIASVSIGFRGGERKEDSLEYFGKGGHLVVAVESTNDEILCNHPSSMEEWNKVYWPVSIEKWRNSFSGNYMEFKECMKKSES